MGTQFGKSVNQKRARLHNWWLRIKTTGPLLGERIFPVETGLAIAWVLVAALVDLASFRTTDRHIPEMVLIILVSVLFFGGLVMGAAWFLLALTSSTRPRRAEIILAAIWSAGVLFVRWDAREYMVLGTGLFLGGGLQVAIWCLRLSWVVLRGKLGKVPRIWEISLLGLVLITGLVWEPLGSDVNCDFVVALVSVMAWVAVRGILKILMMERRIQRGILTSSLVLSWIASPAIYSAGEAVVKTDAILQIKVLVSEKALLSRLRSCKETGAARSVNAPLRERIGLFNVYGVTNSGGVGYFYTSRRNEIHDRYYAGLVYSPAGKPFTTSDRRVVAWHLHGNWWAWRWVSSD